MTSFVVDQRGYLIDLSGCAVWVREFVYDDEQFFQLAFKDRDSDEAPLALLTTRHRDRVDAAFHTLTLSLTARLDDEPIDFQEELWGGTAEHRPGMSKGAADA